MRTILICSLLLCGCCNTKTPVIPSSGMGASSPATDKSIEAAKTFVDFDEGLLKPCEGLPLLSDRVYSLDELLEHKSKEVELYSACSKRHTELSKLVRTYLNVQHPQEVK